MSSSTFFLIPSVSKCYNLSDCCPKFGAFQLKVMLKNSGIFILAGFIHVHEVADTLNPAPC